jgi:hypothetical protein
VPPASAASFSAKPGAPTAACACSHLSFAGLSRETPGSRNPEISTLVSGLGVVCVFGPYEVRARIAEIGAKANVLLEGLSPDTKGFVDAKLRDLGTERRGLQSRLEALETVPYAPLDADAILRDGLAGIAGLPRLMKSASIEERKLVMNAFIAGITVRPDEARLDLLVRPLPMIGATDSTVRLVAGAGFEPATFGL